MFYLYYHQKLSFLSKIAKQTSFSIIVFHITQNIQGLITNRTCLKQRANIRNITHPYVDYTYKVFKTFRKSRHLIFTQTYDLSINYQRDLHGSFSIHNCILLLINILLSYYCGPKNVVAFIYVFFLLSQPHHKIDTLVIYKVRVINILYRLTLKFS